MKFLESKWFTFYFVFAGSEEFVEFNGDVKRVYKFEGGEGDVGPREGSFGPRKIEGTDVIKWYAKRYEHLQCKFANDTADKIYSHGSSVCSF